jgi:hypothetical protein
MAREPHASALADMRDLIATRRREIVPLIESRYLAAIYNVADDLLKVEWRFEAGRLGFAANFAKSTHTIELPSGARPIWQSPSARLDRDGAHLAPWTGISWKTPA